MNTIDEFIASINDKVAQVYVKNKKCCVYALYGNTDNCTFYLSYVINLTVCTIKFIYDNEYKKIAYPYVYKCKYIVIKMLSDSVDEDDEFVGDTVIKVYSLEGILIDTYFDVEYWVDYSSDEYSR